MSLEVIRHLARQFSEHFSSQTSWVTSELTERNELNDVTRSSVASTIDQVTIVSIQSIHVREISRTNSDNDDRQRKVRSNDDLVNGFCHIVDDAITDDEKNVVSLVLLRRGRVRSSLNSLLDDGSKQGRSSQGNVLHTNLISFHNAFYTMHFDTFGVYREAVRNLSAYSTAKSIHRKVTVIIVILKDGTDRHDGLLVFVSSVSRRVDEVKRSGCSRNAI